MNFGFGSLWVPYESSQWGVEKLRMTQRLDTARNITDTLSVLEEKVHSLYILLMGWVLSEIHTSCQFSIPLLWKNFYDGKTGRISLAARRTLVSSSEFTLEHTNLKNKPLQMFEHLFCTPRHCLLVLTRCWLVLLPASEPLSVQSSVYLRIWMEPRTPSVR